ncbi:HoxN/HupN/NixA family nickel/cobalt transporter [Isoptericola sp. NPDC019482]|uniref:HoxN/HupN/NixA family nickel/cobalt transporter n=1 Tax=Isoptericola sp. NPDC019482 TaxID=3154688 RepID=UPI0034798D90
MTRTALVVAALHVVGIGGLAATLALDGGSGAITLVMALTAYGLGLRHAFDADHIATIDNTTRRLVREGRDARGVGLWFSLGHSTVVVGAALLLAVGMQALAPALEDESSPWRRFTGVWGPVVSGTFLLTIAVVNVLLLRRALRAGRRADGDGHHHDLDAVGGPVSWALRRFSWATDRPGRMYGVGLVFGLGFDTATEIGLLAMTASAALGQVPWYAPLPLAVLFAAGMSLLDSLQGSAARRAYAQAGGGAATRGRLRYDVLVTGVSAAAAVGIGGVTLVQVAAEHVPALARVPGASVSLEPYGLVLAGVLLVAWVVGLLGLRKSRRQA